MSRPKIIVVVKWSFDFFEVESLVTIAFVTFIQSSKLNWLLQNLTKNWPAHTSSQWSKKPLCCMPFHQVNASVRSNGNTPNYYLSTLYAPRICNLGPSLLIFRFIFYFFMMWVSLRYLTEQNYVPMDPTRTSLFSSSSTQISHFFHRERFNY